ncbi:MAG: glycosyltransferase, partial [Burkholderiales bacterium]|nr:glycosyltransferase [Burkholderiales bacterium]
NGVDTDYFSPEHAFASPYPADERAIVFTGAMDYWANVDAVTWFAREVLPSIKQTHPAANFYIVGSRPTAEVQALAHVRGVRVTGAVPDTRPYMAHATVAVAPLRIARGIQNKVLEAMAMAKPTVVSEQALEGIEATPGKEILLASDAAAFADKVSRAIAGQVPEMGAAARQRVVNDYSWPRHLRIVEQLLRGSTPTPMDANAHAHAA